MSGFLKNCQYDVNLPGNMSGKNEWNSPYGLWTIEMKPTQLWPPQKSTFCDRSVLLHHGEKYHQPAMASHLDESSGATVSHIAQTMQMSQRTVYSILRRHKENPSDVNDQPRSGRRRATTIAAGTFHEDAHYTPYYTLISIIKISNVIT